MFKRLPRAPGFQVSLLQLEIPARGAIGIVDKHEGRMILQADGLLFHRVLILADECLRKHAKNRARVRSGPPAPRKADISTLHKPDILTLRLQRQPAIDILR